MTTPQSRLLKLADEAVADYNAMHAAGGEAVYPSWVEDVRLLCNAAPGVSTVEDAQAVAWMDPDTQDVISAERKASWLNEYGAGGAAKAATYTRALGDMRHAPAAGDALDADALANEIRRVDGKHTMGAGALADALLPFIQKAITAARNSDTERLDFLVAHRAWVGWSKDRECCAVYRRDDEGYTQPMCGWAPSYLTPREAIDAARAAQRKGDA